MSPPNATAGGGTFTLTVNGTNFAPGATVQWNGTSLPTTFVSSTQLTATVNASLIGSAGTASITVTSGGQTSASASFTIGAPATTGVTVLADVTSNTAGVVNGTCSTPPSVTSFPTAAPSVYLYFEASGVSVGDSAQVNFIQPNGSLYANSSYTFSSVSTSGTVCLQDALPISGAQAASDPGTWTVQVFWDGSSTPLFSLNFTLTGSASTGGGPSITSVAPASATAGSGTFTITVNGSGFVPGDVVLWNGTPLPTTYVNGNQLTATVSAGLISSSGTASITVSSGAGLLFTQSGTWGSDAATTPFSAPGQNWSYSYLIAANPQAMYVTVGMRFQVTAIGSFQYTLNGSPVSNITPNYAEFINSADEGGMILNLSNGNTVAQFNDFGTLADPQQLYSGSESAPTILPGTYSMPLAVYIGPALYVQTTPIPDSAGSLVVTSQSGQTSAPVSFVINASTVAAPAITGLSPSSATAGGAAFTLTVTGTNFAAGATVQWNGTSLPTTFVNSTHLTASVSASLIASAGTASITVASGGQTSAPVSFTINAPSGNSGPTVVTAVISNTNGIVNGSCSTPPSVTSFTTSSPQVWVYFNVTGATVGDSATVNFVRPDGVVYGTYNPSVGYTSECFSYYIGVSGAAAASYPGTWTVEVLWDKSATPLFALNFALLSASSTVTSVLPQFDVGDSFVSDFYVINSGSQTASFSITFYDDNGNPVSIPFSGLGTLSVLSGSVPAGGANFYEAGTPQGTSVTGSAVIVSDPAITIQALFRRQGSDGSYYEAAVPASTGSNEFLVPFDATTFSGNGSQIYTGLAIANMDASNTANVTCTARNAEGAVIPNAITVPALSPLGHWANYLFPALDGQRGTLDCSSNAKIGAMGVRALGTNAISSLPVVLLPNANSGGSSVLPQFDVGDSFVSDFYAVNSGSQPADFSIAFYGDSGSAVSIPFSGLGTLSVLSGSVLADGANFNEAGTPQGTSVTGSAVIVSGQAIAIQALFRRQGSDGSYYEAAVPASTGSNEFLVPFDATTFSGNGSQIYTGLAIANMDPSNTANVTCTARNAQGNVIPNAITVPALSPLGHWANYLFPALDGQRGTLACSSNTKIGAMGVRALGTNAISSLPVILSGVSIPVTGPGVPANIQIVSGNLQTALVDQAFSAPLVIKVTDSAGNPVSGTSITWTVSQGSATPFNSSTSTNAGGQASTNITAGSSAGAVIVTAAVGSITAQFSLTVTAGGTTSVSVYGSGQNVTNGRDNSYQIVADTTGELVAPAAAFVVTSPAQGWATIPGAAWIAPAADQSNATRGPCCANTSDTYRTTFTVSGNPSNVTLNLTVAADDYVDVLLNGNTVFTHPNTGMWGTPVPFSISSGFVSGTNTLDFRVTNGGGPTGLIVAITSAISGLTQVTPGQTLTISGSFNTAASVTTTAVFSDNGGYQVSVLPVSVTSGSVSVLVPPYLNPQSANITSGTVSVSVVQQPASGQATTTAPLNLQIGALPQTGVSPGLITLDVLTQLTQLAGTANQTWSTIAQESGGIVNASQLNLAALQSSLSAAQADVQALVSGTVTQVSLGQIGGQSVYLDINSLALIDQVFFAYYLGSTATPAQVNASFRRRTLVRVVSAHPRQDGDDPLANFHGWFSGEITSTLPKSIASNVLQLRGAATAAIGLVVLITAPAEVAVATAAAVGGVVWMATTWTAAATTAALEGGGSLILNQKPPDVQDFTNTMGIIGNGYFEAATDNLRDAVGETGGQAGQTASTIVQTTVNIDAAVDPEDEDGVTDETTTAADDNLFNSGAQPFNGTWVGTYSFPSTTCPGETQSGTLIFYITQSSPTSFSGSASLSGLKFFNDSDCSVAGTVDSSSGDVSGSVGQGGSLTATASFTLDVSSLPDPLDDSETFSLQGTLSDGTMSGPLNGGTFSLSL